MNKLILGSIVGVLGLASVASADRGYSRARYDASVRYERGDSHRGSSRGYDRGYDRGYSRDYDRGYSRHDRSDYGRDYRRDYGRSRSSFGLSFGYSSYSDSGYIGLRYSSGPRYSTRYSSPRYYAPARVYVAPPVYYYESRTYCPPTYYRPSYGGYYCR